MLGNTRKVLVNDKGGNLMVLPLDQMLKGGNAPAAKSDNGASNLLRLPPASSSQPVEQATRRPPVRAILWTNAAPTRSVTTTSVRGNNDA